MHLKTVPEALENIFGRYQHQLAFVYRQQFFRQEWSYEQFEHSVWQVSELIQSKGLKQGDKVALCGPNSPWWLTVYLACASNGIIIVPLDFNSTSEFIDTILAETKAKLLFLSAFKVHQSTVETLILEDLPHLVVGFSEKPNQLPKVQGQDILEIVFTSGSTGNPKGVVLTHENVMQNVTNFLEAWPNKSNEVGLSLVPLSHMLEQTAGFWAPFAMGCTIVYISSLRPTEITRALKEERVTSVITVPAFLQLLRRRILAETEQSFFAGLLLGTAHYLPHKVARFISWPVRRHLGSQLETFAVGGAALPSDVEDFWNSLGYYVIQGYGLTETSPLATYSSRFERLRGSVGKSLPHQEIKIAKNNELLLRGPHVFKGYYHNEKATAEVFDDEGWFHTGDIAEITEDGFVFLKGRLKNMLLGSNGLNIYPEDIEAKILNYRDVRDVVVLMDNHNTNPVLTAVILTNKDDSYVTQILQEVNLTLASHQIIQNHILWPDTDFPRTPTRKVRRAIIQEAVDNRKTDTPFIPSQDASQIQSILRQLTGTSELITNDTKLATDLAIDSIKRLELVTLIEEKLLVSVDESLITSSTTVGQLEDLINESRTRGGRRTVKSVKGVTRNRFLLPIQSALQAIILLGVIAFQKIEISGRKPYKGPVIFVANHTSHLDAVTFLRMAGFKGRQKLVIAAAADYFFASRFRSWLSRNLVHAIPIEREGPVRQSLELIGRELSLGRSLVVFPEGTRSPDGTIQPFKPGIGLLAAGLQVPIVPVKLEGNFEILPKGARWPKSGLTKVTIGEPHLFSITESSDEIAEVLRRAIEDL